MGLVDSVADPNALLHAAVLAAKGLADGSVKATVRTASDTHCMPIAALLTLCCYMLLLLLLLPLAQKKKKSFLNRVLEDTPLKAIIFKKAKEQVEKNAGPHYPAPYAILRCIEAVRRQHLPSSLPAHRCCCPLMQCPPHCSTRQSTGNKEEGFKTEAREFGKLGMTSVSKSLQGIFFGQTKCKKNPYGKPKANVTVVYHIHQSLGAEA